MESPCSTRRLHAERYESSPGLYGCSQSSCARHPWLNERGIDFRYLALRCYKCSLRQLSFPDRRSVHCDYPAEVKANHLRDGESRRRQFVWRRVYSLVAPNIQEIRKRRASFALCPCGHISVFYFGEVSALETSAYRDIQRRDPSRGLYEPFRRRRAQSDRRHDHRSLLSGQSAGGDRHYTGGYFPPNPP